MPLDSISLELMTQIFTDQFSLKVLIKVFFRNFACNATGKYLLELICFCFFQIDDEADSFNVLIDKGELDMIHKEQSSFELYDFTQHFEAVQRLLKVGGRYICFSLATTDVLDKLLVYFSSGWFFRVHMLNTELLDGKLVSFPLFCFILTKTKSAGDYHKPYLCGVQAETIYSKEDKVGVIFFG